jgi:hypothetical protein
MRHEAPPRASSSRRRTSSGRSRASSPGCASCAACAQIGPVRPAASRPAVRGCRPPVIELAASAGVAGPRAGLLLLRAACCFWRRFCVAELLLERAPCRPSSCTRRWGRDRRGLIATGKDRWRRRRTLRSSGPGLPLSSTSVRPRRRAGARAEQQQRSGSGSRDSPIATRMRRDPAGHVPPTRLLRDAAEGGGTPAFEPVHAVADGERTPARRRARSAPPPRCRGEPARLSETPATADERVATVPPANTTALPDDGPGRG